MPCRPLPSSAGGPKEVEALVAKLGEVLQLSAQQRAPRGCKHPGPGSARDRAAPYSPRCGAGAGAGAGGGGGGGGGSGGSSGSSSSGAPVEPPPPPPRLAGSGRPPRGAKQLCGRGWLRGAARRSQEPRRQQQQQQQRQQHRAAEGPADGQAEDEAGDDPHRLLQQLILSGNLIKEAVRRLQLAVVASNSSSAASSSASSASAASGGDGEALRALQ
nr:GSK-3-binding protein FRAT2-like [Anas platyrhynchos]